MKRVWGLLLVSFWFLQVGALAQVSPAPLYATQDKGKELISIDVRTKSVSLIGPTEHDFSYALAFSPDGTAYTIANLFDPSNAQLATIDINSGTATLVGGPLPGGLLIMGLTVSPEGGLYGAAMPSTTIESINTTSGAPSPVGYSETTGELMSFAYDSQGTLYSASPSNLYTVDLATGKATWVAPLHIEGVTGSPSVMGLAIDDDGTMYATNFVGCPPCSTVWVVNPATGAMTALFNTGVPFIHNIAFFPGTPAQQIQRLEARVSGMGLLGGISTSLNTKLAAALEQVNDSENPAACNIIGAFRNQVDALAGKMISAIGVQQLMFASTRLNTALECP